MFIKLIYYDTLFVV